MRCGIALRGMKASKHEVYKIQKLIAKVLALASSTKDARKQFDMAKLTAGLPQEQGHPEVQPAAVHLQEVQPPEAPPQGDGPP